MCSCMLSAADRGDYVGNVQSKIVELHAVIRPHDQAERELLHCQQREY